MSFNVPHPSQFIDASAAEQIRSYAAEAEQIGELHPEQLSVIYQGNWLKLYVPKCYNGLEHTLPEGLRIQEGLAWTDGSTAWVVTLCSGANWFAGFLSPGVAQLVFSDPRACLAGSGQPSGTATDLGDTYEVTGYWRYASGTPQATAFTANCVIQQPGTVTGSDKEQEIRSFLFLRNEVTIDANWHAMGMIATASHSYQVDKLSVSKNRSFLIDSHNPVLDHPLYRFPFLPFAEATLAVNVSGMVMRFLDLCEDIIHYREKHSSKEKVSLLSEQLLAAKQRMQGLRDSFYTTMQQAWDECVAGKDIPDDLCREISHHCRTLAIEARRLTDELYPMCGMRAADRTTEINRVWRNIHTASQHMLLQSVPA